ncbi:MAG: hypothetical protein JXR86_13400 [Spirochaetales bacterium]|nr:hypothetical protein [Spirochaetales bacterium]
MDKKIRKMYSEEIPDFQKLREMELYAVIKRSFDLNNLDPWCSSFMNGRKKRLEEEVPFFPLDLSLCSRTGPPL